MAQSTGVGSQDLDREILLWTKLQVPKDLELTDEWDGLFLPLIQAPGQLGSGWARLQDSKTILLLTEWKRILDHRDFIASPSAQVYHENLQSRGIVHVSSHETPSRRFKYLKPLLESYVQLFWIHFAVPVTETQMAQISKIKSIRGPAVLRNFTNDLNASHENLHPVKMWATHTESVNGQEVQLLLWPHFWKSAERAEIRHVGKFARSGNAIVGGTSRQERFCANLETVGPMGWTEEFLSFRTIPEL